MCRNRCWLICLLLASAVVPCVFTVTPFHCVGPEPSLPASFNPWAWASIVLQRAKTQFLSKPLSSNGLKLMQILIERQDRNLAHPIQCIRCLTLRCNESYAIDLSAYFLLRYSLALEWSHLHEAEINMTRHGFALDVDAEKHELSYFADVIARHDYLLSGASRQLSTQPIEDEWGIANHSSFPKELVHARLPTRRPEWQDGVNFRVKGFCCLNPTQAIVPGPPLCMRCTAHQARYVQRHKCAERFARCKSLHLEDSHGDS